MNPTGQMVMDMVDEQGDVPASLLVGAAMNMTPEDRMRLFKRVHGGRHHHHHHHGGGDVTGWGLSNLFHHAKKATPLLVSATPGGVTALAAHQVASKALKSGALDPNHLKKAAALTKRGSKGDQAALVQIAKVKQLAGKGDKNAEIALDRIKLAHCLQTGGRCAPGSAHPSTFRRQYAAGANLMHLRPSH